MMKRRAKGLLGRMLFGSGLHRPLLRRRGIVVLFHRVDDRLAGDPISITVREFEAFCRFFRRHFDVIPLSELVRRAEVGADLSGTLAITFDDGYKDNVTTAAPILTGHGLPACFFIATDFIGSDFVPWWDEGLGVRPGWMTWDDVRALRDAGFEIGAHTRTHADLGVVAGDQAEAEISGSVKRLEAELGRPVRHFSYPYGRPSQLTDANRTLIMDLGLRSCLSAFGGSVRNGDSPFHLHRQPISRWYVSPWQFGFEMAVSGD